VLAAVVYTWPLVRHISSTLTGSPDGDAGVYVWNQWVFRHELLEHGRLPYFTDTLFGPNHIADLSLHNYTVFLDLLAMPFIGLFGVVTTFNLVYLCVTVITAYATYLLARDLQFEPRVAWLTGLLFAWSPVLATRGMGHYSLVAAAPLPLFLLLLRRAWANPRVSTALALGATLAWAATTDVYYAVYCVLLAAAFLTAQIAAVDRADARRWQRAKQVLTLLIVIAGGLVLTIAASGGGSVHVASFELRAHSLYTPVLVLTVLVLLRLACTWRLTIAWPSRESLLTFARLTCAAGILASILLSPFLYAIGLRIATGRFVRPDILWRSSPQGVDLLSMLMPNPNHPWSPAGEAAWLNSRPDGYMESVGALPLTAVALCLLAFWKGWRPARWTIAMTIFFGLLALGPFVTVGGHSTYVPTPWVVLRFVPIIELARAPARFAVVLTMFVAVLYGSALTTLLQRTRKVGAVLAAAGVVLALELLPAPRTLYAANVPSIYREVHAAPQDAAVLELPFGIRDGTMSIGNFSARTQFYQTAHERTVMGGYLSRVSRTRALELEADPVKYPLALLSEGKSISPADRAAVVARGPGFLRDNHIAFIVIDRQRTPPALRDLAMQAFHLEPVDRDGALDLFRPDPSAGDRRSHAVSEGPSADRYQRASLAARD